MSTSEHPHQTSMDQVPLTDLNRLEEASSVSSGGHRHHRESMSQLRAIESEASLERDLSADHPDVTRKELWGWYMFEWASQPFSSAGLGIFFPLILEDLAWRAGTSNPGASDLPPCPDRTGMTPAQLKDTTCFVQFGNSFVTPESFALFISAISVALQVISFISVGTFADYSRWRKHFLLLFSVIASFACILFLVVINPSLYWLAAVLVVIGNVAFGTAMVFYNAYLPILVDALPDMRQLKQKIENRLFGNPVTMAAIEASAAEEHPKIFKDVEEMDRPLSADPKDAEKEANEELHKLRDKLANRVSTNAFATSYTSAVVNLLILGGFLLGMNSDSIYLVQICSATLGVWWLVFMFAFTARWLGYRPGPSLPKEETSYVLFAWKKTFRTIGKARRLKNTFLFLASWFFYADAYSTISTVAILYGKRALDMTTSQLMIIAITGPLLAVVGNYAILYVLHTRLKLASRTILIILICAEMLLPIYGLIGLVVPEDVPFGLHTVPEMYALSCYYGFLLGALQSFSRVCFAELIPPGMESEFFALYEITDRGSSWLGPVLCAVIATAFKIQYGFFVILALFLISLPFLFAVDMQEGKRAARQYVQH